jgi:hypothetical protein
MNQLIYVTAKCGVSFAVQSEVLNIQTMFSFKELILSLILNTKHDILISMTTEI